MYLIGMYYKFVVYHLCIHQYKNYKIHFLHSLRRRLKAQHDVITSQSTRLACLQANVEEVSPVQDHSTGQSECT